MKKEVRQGMAERIKERRKALRYTQEQVAEKVGISASSYTRIENEFQNPALETLIKISELLDLSLDYIVFGKEDKKPKADSSTDILRTLLSQADDDKLLYASDMLSKIVQIKNVRQK